MQDEQFTDLLRVRHLPAALPSNNSRSYHQPVCRLDRRSLAGRLPFLATPPVYQDTLAMSYGQSLADSDCR
jgi:hypothetical protein